MTATIAVFRGRGWRITVAMTATLLFTLLVFAFQPTPASAQEETYTLNVSTQGNGKVTGPGIDCGNGGTDCTEIYPVTFERHCEPNPDPPPAEFCHFEPVYQEVTLTTSPAPGWAFQSWGGACSGNGTCALTMNQNHSVSSTFIRVSPPNDDFANSQVISGASASVNGTTKDATRESGEPNHCLNSADCNGTNGVPWPGDHTVWYRWTAPYSGWWKMDTCQANIDSILAVYTGGQLNALSRVAENNNGCSSGFGSKLTFNALKDQTYYIGVDGCCGAPQGTFTLALNLVDDVAPDTQITQGEKAVPAQPSARMRFCRKL